MNKNSFACELPDSPFVTMMKSGFDIGLMLDEDVIAHFGAGGCAPVEGSVPLDPSAFGIVTFESTISERMLASMLVDDVGEDFDTLPGALPKSEEEAA